MAERRMFAKTIIDSDAFLDMPLSSQALYFHLSMRADDDGFINNPKKIQRMVGSSEDDLKLLIAKRFIIAFESGVIVIKHWKIHNYIQKDRYKPTLYQEEKSILTNKNNNSYTVETDCIHDGYSLETQVRLGKDSLVKASIGKERKVGETQLPSFPTPIHEIIFNQFGNITYQMWFRDSKIEVNGELVIITVSDEHKKLTIENEFLEVIRTLTGKSISVKAESEE